MEAKEEEIWTVWQAAVEALRGSVCERGMREENERGMREENERGMREENEREMRKENERGMREDDEREANINEREMTHPTNANTRIDSNDHSIIHPITHNESPSISHNSTTTMREPLINATANPSIPFTSPRFARDPRYLQETESPQPTPFTVSAIETWLRRQPIDAAHFLTLLIRWMRNALIQVPSLAKNGGFTQWVEDVSIQHLVAAVAEMAQSMAQSPSSAQEALMKRTFTELCDELASIAPAGMVHVTAYVRLTNTVYCSVFFIASTETPLTILRCVNTRTIIWRRCRWTAFWYSFRCAVE